MARPEMVAASPFVDSPAEGVGIADAVCGE